MTFPQKTGSVLLVVAAVAVWGHLQGLALPSLRWFFSFDADPGKIADAASDLESEASWWGERKLWFLQSRGLLVGWIFCGAMALAGLSMIVGGRKFQWNPLTLRRLARFRSIGRGWLAFRILMALLVLALLDQALVGKRALAVNYEGTWHFPAFQQRTWNEEDFGGEGEHEVNYRELAKRFAREGEGNRVVMPLVPWDPTFDSHEVFRRQLDEIDGKLHRPGSREPFNGRAVQFQMESPEIRIREARFRKGLREGTASVYDEKGEFAGREEWENGRLVESRVGNAPPPENHSWIELVYPPSPPSWKERHFLGTDSKGWDIAAQVYGGMQVIFKAAILYIALTYGIGITLGCMMGFFGGRFDLIMHRATEVLSNVPFLLVVMIITANIGRDKIDLATILLIFCIFSWIGVAIYLRTGTYKEKARDYVSAARVQGAGTARVIFRHILPNAVSTIVTLLPFSVAGLATSLTALDFLGFGLPDRYPSWGRVLDDGTANLSSPWIVSSVFAVMVGVLLLITFVGEAIREAFDPKKFTTYQ